MVVHEVRPALGGQLLMANREPSKGKSYEGLIGHYEALMKKHGVKWHIDSPVKAALIRKERPSVVVLATGASVPQFNSVPTDGVTVISLEEALIEDKVASGSRVAILSGERAGLVAAEYLTSEKGCSVSVVEESPRMGTDVDITFIWRHMAWIKDMGVNALKKHRIKSVNNGHVILADAEDNEVKIEADVLIQAGPRRSRQELEEEFKPLVDELYLVGDAINPRSLPEAIHEGFKLGVRI
ncbi:FAD-dependent oxidoreductase [Thermodesulfobacteriota bacterium]